MQEVVDRSLFDFVSVREIAFLKQEQARQLCMNEDLRYEIFALEYVVGIATITTARSPAPHTAAPLRASQRNTGPVVY
jgi:hypothetical protein